MVKKWQTKFDCLLYEMFFIKELKPSLNTQEDSIRAKVFTWLRLSGKHHNFIFEVIIFVFTAW